MEALSRHYSVITFDNRGIGASETTDDDVALTIEGMAEDALAILNAEGINRCHVVGHSMGGLIAAQLALISPRRVKSLAFLCTFPDGKSGARLTWDTFVAGMRTRIGTRRMRRKAFLSLVLSKAGMHDSARGELEATMAELFARDLADQPRIIMRQLAAMSRYDAKWRLRFLSCIRTLVVSGRGSHRETGAWSHARGRDTGRAVRGDRGRGACSADRITADRQSAARRSPHGGYSTRRVIAFES